MKILAQIVLVALITFVGCNPTKQPLVDQITISRVKEMPNQPAPYKMLDWKEKSHKLR